MPPAISALVVLATEGGIPTSNPWSQVAVPLAIVIFVGSVYLLLRSNLGTRRGYLVLGTCLWGFTSILATFWTFGAPGTPPATGPQNLPGQQLNEYEPTWTPFAQDSAVAERPEYAVAANYPEGFGPVPGEFEAEAGTGADEIANFFSGFDPTDDYRNVIEATWEPVATEFAEATNGYPIIAVTYQQTCQIDTNADIVEGEDPPLTPEGCEGAQIGDVAEDGDTAVLFGFFDAGNPSFPSYVMLGVVLALFLLHALLLSRDESRERRERVVEPAADEPVEAGASAR